MSRSANELAAQWLEVEGIATKNQFRQGLTNEEKTIFDTLFQNEKRSYNDIMKNYNSLVKTGAISEGQFITDLPVENRKTYYNGKRTRKNNVALKVPTKGFRLLFNNDGNLIGPSAPKKVAETDNQRLQRILEAHRKKPSRSAKDELDFIESLTNDSNLRVYDKYKQYMKKENRAIHKEKYPMIMLPEAEALAEAVAEAEAEAVAEAEAEALAVAEAVAEAVAGRDSCYKCSTWLSIY